MVLDEVMQLFGIGGAVKFSELESGHINNTFIAECENGQRYIVQSLNTRVFRRPEAVMKNISRIEKAFSAFDGNVAVPHYLCTEDGANFVELSGEVYRMYNYIVPVSDRSDSNYMTGFSFGTFLRLLGKKSIRLETTIESFHSYSSYFSALTAADKNSRLKKIDRTVMRRLDSLRDTLEQVFTVDFPKRSIHSDAKISNIVFGEKCTIIDLDTAMPGYAAIDYGDMIRSVCTAERIDYKAIQDITKGFADGLDGALTDDEIYSLYYGILYVTGELAVRYLIDYISDEKYFRGKTSAQCLSRANELLRQLSAFISEGDEIISIIYKAFRKQ